MNYSSISPPVPAMPAAELAACAFAGAIAAAVLMNWAEREHRRLKRARRVNEAYLVRTATFMGLSLLAACLGGVDWEQARDLSGAATGAVLLGMVVGGVTGNPRGLGLGSADGDAGDGPDGGDGGGE